MDRRVTPSTGFPHLHVIRPLLLRLLYKFATYLQEAFFYFHPVELKKTNKQTEFYEQMTSNLVFTERNVQKANAYRFPCIYRKDTVVGCPWLS